MRTRAYKTRERERERERESVFDHTVNTREIYRNTQYRTRVLKIRENLFLKKEKINSKFRRNKHIIIRKKKTKKSSFFLFSETFPRAPPPANRT